MRTTDGSHLRSLLWSVLILIGCGEMPHASPPAPPIECPVLNIKGPEAGIRNLTKIDDQNFKYAVCGNEGAPCYLSARNRVIIVPDLTESTSTTGVRFTIKQTDHPFVNVELSYTAQASWFAPDGQNGWTIQGAAYTWYNLPAQNLAGKKLEMTFTDPDSCIFIFQFELSQVPDELNPDIKTTLQNVGIE